MTGGITAVAAASARFTPVLAHQGGWDEFLLVAAPVAAFAGILYTANRRARLVQQERAATATGDGPTGDEARPGTGRSESDTTEIGDGPTDP